MSRSPDERIRLMLCSEPGNAGVKRHVCDILRHIDTERFEVLFIYSLSRADSTYAKEIEAFGDRGLQCVEVPMVRSLRPGNDLTSLVRLRRFMRSFRPHVLHCHSAKAGFLGRLATAGLQWRPKVLYTPNAMPCYISNVYLRLERFAGRWTDFVIAVSESEKGDIGDWSVVPPSKLVVLPMGVEDSAQPPIVIADSIRRIGACGRICAQKNAKLFFEAMLPLLDEDPNLELVWIGDHSNDDESLWVQEQLSMSANSDRVTVTGWVEDAIGCMRSLDLFAMMSAYESFGFVTADAMMNGIPIVAIDGTGTRDLVRGGETGWLTDGSVESVQEAVREAMRQPEMRQRYAEKASEFVRREFALGECLANVYRFYDRMAGD